MNKHQLQGISLVIATILLWIPFPYNDTIIATILLVNAIMEIMN